MAITTHITKSKINDNIPKETVFIGYASFEQRSVIAPLSINNNQIKTAIIFHSKGNDDGIARESMNKHFECVAKFVELDLGDPISIARVLTVTIKELLSSTPVSLVIDITTFTHETLLMLLKLVLTNKDRFRCVRCLYNGADKYSVGDSLDEAWLSKGCKDVRNVIGYPGLLRPSAKNCLILLTGFELERATRLIELIEPDKLLLGSGEEPTSSNNKDLMDYFHGKFDDWKSSYKNVDCSFFRFSCKNVEKTIETLSRLTAENSEDNFIIVPLNTKLSTIATSIVALQNNKIQVCYSIPETYNTKNYSSPSENITIVSLYENGIISQ